MSQYVTAAQIKAIAGGGRSDLIAAIVRGWPAAVAKAGLTTKLRAAHFLAEIMTETGGLTILEESGAYKAPRIMAIFGVGHHSAAITAAEAKQIAALPLAQRGPVLFNRVYGRGNPKKMREFNNTGPNDGWLYRGGGMMQATGKNNYAAMEKKTGLPLVAHPEMLHQPDSAFLAAYLEWAQDGRCNAAADADKVVTVRKIINGGDNGLAECRKYLAKAKTVLADYGGTAPAAIFAEPVVEPTDAEIAAAVPEEPGDVAVPAQPAQPPTSAVIDPDTEGDPDLFSVKKRLRKMNYNPGVQNGVWGGMTAGAISGFINDRGGFAPAPTSLDMFHEVIDDLKAELSRAESEAPPFTRPVTEERKAGDAKVVAEVAPEVVPAKRGFWATVGTFIIGVLTWAQDTVMGAVNWAWGLFSEHKDDLPDDPEIRSSIWQHVQAVPHAVWWVLGLSALAWLAFNNWSVTSKITAAVKTGARQ